MSAKSSVGSVLGKLYEEYKSSTPTKIKLVDAYMFCIMLTGIIQFVYCCLVGTYPFNAFLSGFISTVGCFVLGGNFCLNLH
jgi:oligosaccharyltransferase complex subunit epsilon